MNDTVTRRRGETIRLKLTLFEGARNASPRRDLSGTTLSNASIGQSFPSPSLAILDAEQGEVEVLWTDEQTATMKPGRVHAFRLGIDYEGGDRDVIGDIWLNLL